MTTTTDTVTRCDVCDGRNDVLPITITVEHTPAEGIPPMADIGNKVKLDLCKRDRKRLAKFIERGINPPSVKPEK